MTSTDNPGYVQIGWRSRLTGEICDCPIYERSPHANSDPVYVPAEPPPYRPRLDWIADVEEPQDDPA